jgi:hypothetical protein
MNKSNVRSVETYNNEDTYQTIVNHGVWFIFIYSVNYNYTQQLLLLK